MDKNGKSHVNAYWLAMYPIPPTIDDEMDRILSIGRRSDNERNLIEKMYGLDIYKGGLYTFDVKHGIKRIGTNAFAYNLNLKDISLPEGLEIIDSYAFFYCESMKKITIPSTVYFIGEDAFWNKLDMLILLCETPPKITTIGVNDKCKIIVPAKAFETYRNTRRWKKYAKQIHPSDIDIV